MADNKLVTFVVVGCGMRGTIYASYQNLHPELCKVVGIAEPREFRRQQAAEQFSVPAENVFSDWKDLVAKGKIADAAVITTQDQLHKEPAVALANLGYHILLEKPMATKQAECDEIHDAIKKNNVLFAVGHVMRYTPYSRKVKELLESGIIGDILNIQHCEPVGWFHFAHSYVRGNWRREDESCFSLMTKSCHDVDWILWAMDKKCTKVSSFGTLKHFNSANKPQGAASRCLDCSVESTCSYSAKKLYLTGPIGVLSGNTSWPNNVITDVPTEESILTALKEGPYGRCVYESDNDVVDNQVVNFQFEDGSTASFTMIATSKEVCVRKTKIFGTKGELKGDGKTKIKVFDFLTQKTTSYEPETCPDRGAMQGHHGGDYELMKAFVAAVAQNDQTLLKCDVNKTLRSHTMVFSAEKSRKENKVIDLSW